MMPSSKKKKLFNTWIRQAVGSPSRCGLSISVCVLVGCFVWLYWGTLTNLARRWEIEPEYSHGYFIPLVSLAWLWYRRKDFLEIDISPSWWGLAFLGTMGGMCLFAEFFYYGYFQTVSLLVCLAGLVVLLAGWRHLLLGWPAIAFLFLMVPLPSRLSGMLAHPLQRMTTLASTYILQTIGLPAVAEGNIVTLKSAEIGIVEACSGLRMLVFFFAASTAVAMFSKRVSWEKVLIVVSAIPIAIASNLIRVIVTGLLHEYAGSEIADKVFHDFAGVLMAPLALGLLLLEIKLIDLLLIEPPEGPVPVHIVPD